MLHNRQARAPSRERVVVPTERRRLRRACADRAVDTRARRDVCAVSRVTSPRLLLSASHRRFGSVRAGTGDAERAPANGWNRDVAAPLMGRSMLAYC